MKKSHYLTICVSTFLSIVFFSIFEKENQNSSVDSSAQNGEGDSLSSLRAITDNNGGVRIIRDGIKAPGKNPYYDEIGTLHWEREARPFEIVQTKGDFSWTAEDGMSEEVMEQLANNNDMLAVLKRDNAILNRRQLVYFDEENFHKKRDAIMDGKLSELVLPGFEGEEIKMLITSYHREESTNPEIQDAGYFTGKVDGYPQSNIAIGSSNGGYAIQVDYNGRSYQYDLREKGELIVSDFNLAKMETLAAAEGVGCRFGLGQHVGTVIEN